MALGGIELATAYVSLTVSAKGINKSISNELSGLGGVGKTHGSLLGGGIAQGLDSQTGTGGAIHRALGKVGSGISGILPHFRKGGSTAGAEFGAGMTDANPMAGFTRDARGKLHDERGKFVAEGRDAGSAYGQNLSSSLGQTVEKETGGGGSIGRAFGSLARVGALAFVAVGAGAAAAAGWGLSVASDAQTAQVSFETLLGSSEAAADELGKLRDFAAKTPFEFPELRDAASRFLAVGVEADRVIPIMTTLGDATSAMGTGSEGINRATTALTQMATKGVVTAEEMMQLTEAGIPAWDALAAVLNTDVAGAQELVSKRQVDANTLFAAIETSAGPALQRVTGMMDEQSKTLKGLGSTLKDTLGLGLSAAMAPTVEALTVLLPSLSESLGGLIATLGPQLGRIIGKVLTGLEKFMPAIEPVLGLFLQLGEQLVDNLLPVFEALLPAVAPLFKAFSAAATVILPAFQSVLVPIATLIAGLLQAVAPLIPAIAGLATAFLGGLSAAITPLVPIITQMVTQFAQFLLPVIQQLSPIIGELMAIFGKLLVDVLTPLLPVLMQVAETLITALLPVIQQMAPIMADNAKVFADLLVSLIPLIPLVVDLLAAVLPLIQFFAQFNLVITETVAAITGPLLKALVALVAEIVGPITKALGWLVDKFMEVWDSIYQSVAPFLQSVTRQVENGVQWIKDAWQKVSALATAFVDNVVTPILGKVQPFMSDVAGAFQSGIDTVKSIWLGMKAIVTSFVDDVINPVGSVAIGLVKTLGDAFQTAVDTVKFVWDTLQDVVKAPVRFVVDTIYNDGIRKVWNFIATKIGFDPLDPVTLGFATGGYVPGQGMGDKVPALLTPDELIVKQKASRWWQKLLGRQNALTALNEPWKHTLDPGIFGYAKGGYAHTAQETLNFAQEQAGKPYQFPLVGPAAFDCSGLISAILAFVHGMVPPWRRLVSTGTIQAGQYGLQSGPGDPSKGFAIGVERPNTRNRQGVVVGHMAGTIMGTNVEAASSAAGVRVGGAARGWNNPMFGESFSLANFGGLSDDEKETAKSLASLRGIANPPKGNTPVEDLISGLFTDLPGKVFHFLTGALPGAIVDAVKDALGDVFYDEKALSATALLGGRARIDQMGNGAYVTGGLGGVIAQIGEARHDEIVAPVPHDFDLATAMAAPDVVPGNRTALHIENAFIQDPIDIDSMFRSARFHLSAGVV